MKNILHTYPHKYMQYLNSFSTFCDSPEENVVGSAGLILCLLIGHHKQIMKITNNNNICIQKSIQKLEELQWHNSQLVK